MKKVMVNEDDLKKVVLILKLSKGHVQVPSTDLTLANLWRVSSKLADKLMKTANLTLVTTNGRVTLRSVTEETSTTEVVRTPRTRKCKK